MAEKQSYKFTNEVDTVEVTALGAKIIIRLHEGNEILAEYENPRDVPEFCAVLSGKTLTLKENISFNIGMFNNRDSVIMVYLPVVTYSKLKINTTSGGVEVTGVTADTLDLNTASGEINISSYFEEIKVQSASGTINLTNPIGKPAKSISIRNVSGNTNILGYRAETYSIHSISGRTNYDSASGAGSIAVTSGNVTVNYAEWNNDLNISIISGNINVILPENSGIELNFDGISGILKTDLGNERGNFMNIGKGTSGVFGGENKHKLSVNVTSGNVTISQAPEEKKSDLGLDETKEEQ